VLTFTTFIHAPAAACFTRPWRIRSAPTPSGRSMRGSRQRTGTSPSTTRWMPPRRSPCSTRSMGWGSAVSMSRTSRRWARRGSAGRPGRSQSCRTPARRQW